MKTYPQTSIPSALPEQLADDQAPTVPVTDSPLLVDEIDPERFFNYRPWAY